MNILDAEDLIKGLPDATLTQEAQMPSGQLPQFLVISEIQRRTDMRKRFDAQQEQPQGTVADRIVQEGIMGMMPQQPMGMPQGMPQAMPPMGMAAGGITRMANGGVTKIQSLMDLLAVNPRITAADLVGRGFTLDEVEAARSALSQRMSMPVGGSIPSVGTISESEGQPRMGYGDQYDPPFIPGVTDVISDKVSEVADAVGRGIESFRLEAQKQMPNYGLVGRNDLSLPSLPMPDRMSQAEMAKMFSPEEVAERLANSPSLADDLDMTPMEFFRQRVLGKDPELGIGPEGPVRNAFGTQKPGTEPATPYDEALEVVQESQTDASSPDFNVMDDYFANLNTGDKSVQGDSPIQTQAKPPKLDISDILDESRKMTQANMLMQLGAGIAGGDLSKGISAAGAAGMKGAQQQQALDIRKRLAEYQAGREDIARGEKSKQFYDQLAVIEKRYDNELEKSARIGRNELFRTASALVEAAAGETLTSGPERQAMVEALMNKYLTMYAPSFGVTNIPTMPPPPSGAGRPSLASFEAG